MATGGNIEEDSLSEEYYRSLSGERRENYCDPCQVDGIEIQADGFCVDCNDYLCSDCNRAHKKAKPSRNHVLHDKTTMPLSKPIPSASFSTEKCSVHETEYLRLYCRAHDIAICDICRALQHRKCEHVKLISEVCSGFFSSAEFVETKVRLMTIKKELTKHLNDVNENTSEIKNIYNKVNNGISQILANVRDKDLEHLKFLQATCDTSLKNVTELCNKLKSLETSGETSQAFITKTKVESQIKSYEDILLLMKDDNKITKYYFVPTPIFIKSGMAVTLSEKKLKMEDVGNNTNYGTWISGLDRLDDNKLAVGFRNESKLKLVNMSSKRVLARIKLNSKPWDLTKIDNKSIALTTYANKKILLISFTDRLCVYKTINKRIYKYCQGIIYHNGSLIVSYNCPNKIEIVDLNGDVKQTIESKDKQGATMFGDVQYMAKHHDKDILYLSDSLNDKIISMTLDGKIISSYSHEHLILPKGITVSKGGRVFVCSYYTHKIFELSSDLSEGRIVMDDNAIAHFPCSIVYNDEENKLYIGNDRNDID